MFAAGRNNFKHINVLCPDEHVVNDTLGHPHVNVVAETFIWTVLFV